MCRPHQCSILHSLQGPRTTYSTPVIPDLSFKDTLPLCASCVTMALRLHYHNSFLDFCFTVPIIPEISPLIRQTASVLYRNISEGGRGIIVATYCFQHQQHSRCGCQWQCHYQAWTRSHAQLKQLLQMKYNIHTAFFLIVSNLFSEAHIV